MPLFFSGVAVYLVFFFFYKAPAFFLPSLKYEFLRYSLSSFFEYWTESCYTSKTPETPSPIYIFIVVVADVAVGGKRHSNNNGSKRKFFKKRILFLEECYYDLVRRLSLMRAQTHTQTHTHTKRKRKKHEYTHKYTHTHTHTSTLTRRD